MDPFFELDGEPLESTAAIVIATQDSPGPAETLAAEPLGASTVLDALLGRLGELPMVVVVVREESDFVSIAEHENVVLLVDPEWREQAAPLRAALDYLTQSGDVTEAFVVAVDAPELPSGVLAEISLARRQAGTPAAVPKYRYVRGGPALLGSDLWPRFLGMEGDLDVDAHLQAHPQWVAEIRVDYPPPRRISTVADLEELAR